MEVDGRDLQDASKRVGSHLRSIFPHLTPKQHEVLRFVAENRTSKEIAWDLGISESAVNQRIEGVRGRAGSPPRAELARAYRQYLQDLDAACNPVTDKIYQVPETSDPDASSERDDAADQFALADAMTFTVKAPWQNDRVSRIVPEVLDGKNAGLSRVAAMVVIAFGMLLIAMVGLVVARALSDIV
ncbi:two component LuxR family transcriptional regulator [Novosphingobium sp. Rr 2-17]|uniref:sigma factor-like helix-turn-helix DNA-binding protein n=1 Tax=Novosphingobium sp. Rr 2-17 TaxID=555793 RepID=UPI00026984EA|nr:LuxR C-terminal-related transcriptional regulator [Novosphingobium sp. Rr 2-17]EIZ79986.1 two component LuxR family transcriptional regulator [Novosphingobium sp. Rr 2-17]